MATPEEVTQAAQILEARKLTLRQVEDGWVVELGRRRVYPARASQTAPDPWLAVIAADAALASETGQGRGDVAVALLRELERGLHLRPKLVDEIDPETGQPIQVLRWEHIDAAGTVLAEGASATELLVSARNARLGGR